MTNKQQAIIAIGVGAVLGLALTLPQAVRSIRATNRGEPSVLHFPHQWIPLITVTLTPDTTKV